MRANNANNSPKGPPLKNENLTWLNKSTMRRPRPEQSIRLSATGAPKVARCAPKHCFGDFGEAVRPYLPCCSADFWYQIKIFNTMRPFNTKRPFSTDRLVNTILPFSKYNILHNFLQTDIRCWPRKTNTYETHAMLENIGRSRRIVFVKIHRFSKYLTILTHPQKLHFVRVGRDWF